MYNKDNIDKILVWTINFAIHHFALSQDSCLGGYGPSIYL